MKPARMKSALRDDSFSPGGPGLNVGKTVIPDLRAAESFRTCLICSKNVKVGKRDEIGEDFHCKDCSGRVNTFHNVISSVEKVEGNEQTKETSCWSSVFQMLATQQQAPLRDEAISDFGEMDWNYTPSSHESKNLFFPRHIPTIPTEPPQSSSLPTSSKISMNKVKLPRSMSRPLVTNPGVIPAIAKNIIVASKFGPGKQKILATRLAGKIVKSPRPLVLNVEAKMMLTSQSVLGRMKPSISMKYSTNAQTRPVTPVQHAARVYTNQYNMKSTINVQCCGYSICPICRVVFADGDSLNCHMRDSHAKQFPFTCIYCRPRIQFRYVFKLIEHKKNQHRNLYLRICSSCGFESKDDLTFQAHVNSSPDKYVICECGLKFIDKLFLTHHREETNNACSSAEPESRMNEIKVKKEIEGELCQSKEIGLVASGPIRCSGCPQNIAFAAKEYLDLHVQFRHSGAPVLRCQFCKLKFSKMSEVISHQLSSHTGQFSWICKHCGVCFVHESEYCSHLNSHSIVTYDCKCGEQFATEQSLEKHGREAHPSVIKFKCFDQVGNVSNRAESAEGIASSIFPTTAANATRDSNPRIQLLMKKEFLSTQGVEAPDKKPVLQSPIKYQYMAQKMKANTQDESKNAKKSTEVARAFVQKSPPTSGKKYGARSVSVNEKKAKAKQGKSEKNLNQRFKSNSSSNSSPKTQRSPVKAGDDSLSKNVSKLDTGIRRSSRVVKPVKRE